MAPFLQTLTTPVNLRVTSQNSFQYMCTQARSFYTEKDIDALAAQSSDGVDVLLTTRCVGHTSLAPSYTSISFFLQRLPLSSHVDGRTVCTATTRPRQAIPSGCGSALAQLLPRGLSSRVITLQAATVCFAGKSGFSFFFSQCACPTPKTPFSPHKCPLNSLL